MKNYQKLNNMALIDLMCYFDVCPRMENSELLFRCKQTGGNCYKCRAAWLNEEEMKEAQSDDRKRV